MDHIPFNIPHLTGKEGAYIMEAVGLRKLSGNGKFTQACQALLREMTYSKKTLLTSSCTDALEMAALLFDISPGDEVIMPSYTFVSTANAFVLRGAKIRFVDSRSDHPGMDEGKIEEVINERTKAIVPVHYAGVACDMDIILDIANSNKLFVVEDAAQGIDSRYKEKALGSMGDLGAFSFHETKNIISGEGGALLVNSDRFEKRSEIIWEKGTNRAAFWRGEVDKYGWVDIGSSYLPSEVTAAFLLAQLEQLHPIQHRRLHLWRQYASELQYLEDEGLLKLPVIPDYASNNAHMFYLVCKSDADRAGLIEHLKEDGVNAVFHYLALHHSQFYKSQHDGRVLMNCDKYAGRLVRLPLYFDLNDKDQERVIDSVCAYYKKG